jgi:hypothetical protein
MSIGHPDACIVAWHRCDTFRVEIADMKMRRIAELPAGLVLARVMVAAGLAAGFASQAEAADVGVSINFSQPGVYGRIDIGAFPQPEVIVAQPVIIAPPPPRAVLGPAPEPVYMWVPPEHQRRWGYYCHQYHACGVPVYFVKHDWYEGHVMHGHGRAEGRDHARGRDERHEDRDRGERDRGKGRDEGDRGERGRGRDRD